jgi:hypothetical protein
VTVETKKTGAKKKVEKLLEIIVETENLTYGLSKYY